MNKSEQIRIVIISYVLTIFGTFIYSNIITNNEIVNGVINSMKLSTILTAWWMFYFKYGWKSKYINWILYRKNLNGTWYGTYISQSCKGEQYTGDIVLRINQNFLTISVISYTEKFNNYSYSEEVKYDEKSNQHGLIYSYSQKEKIPFDFSCRNGTSDLVLSNYNDTIKLKGEFWTILGSRGELDIVRISESIVDTFEEGKKLYEKSKYNKEDK